jgi:hypothetical protein
MAAVDARFTDKVNLHFTLYIGLIEENRKWHS